MQLKQIVRALQVILNRLDDIDKKLSPTQQTITFPESKLYTLPDHLRKTYLAAASQPAISASQASHITGRTRAAESSYLNQLVRLGWLTKCSCGRIQTFMVARG